MATVVTLINNSLVNEYLHYDANGQDVIVHSSLTQRRVCDYPLGGGGALGVAVQTLCSLLAIQLTTALLYC